MPARLTDDDVVIWRGRNVPGKRVIPPHLKLAILSRGRIQLPPRNVLWMLQKDEQGIVWPSQMAVDLLPKIYPALPVTIELFLNQRLTMTTSDIDTTLHAYLVLRHAQHLKRCTFLLSEWLPHAQKQDLEKLLDVDLRMLYSKPRVQVAPRDSERYILFVYVCLPAPTSAPRRPAFVAAPKPSQTMPPLEGMTSLSAEMMLRTKPIHDPTSTILGQQMGDSIRVRVLAKDLKDKTRQPLFPGNPLWYKIELLSPLTVMEVDNQGIQTGAQKVLPAGKQPNQELWVASGGLDYITAPWAFFRYQLSEFEKTYSSLSLDDRITLLRQMSESKELQADNVIGTQPGSVYLENRLFRSDRWQIAKDYETVRTPDGRVVEIKHLLSGIDVLRRSTDKTAYVWPKELRGIKSIGVGSNYAAVTWSGDLGAAAVDMTLRRGEEWELRNKHATFDERANFYFTTRAWEQDLLSDVDIWGIHALRSLNSPSLHSIDSLLAFYYEYTMPGDLRTLTWARKDALELFLKKYGFTYDRATDLAKFPALSKQRAARRGIRDEIARFGEAWKAAKAPLKTSVPTRLTSPSVLAEEDREAIEAMTDLFLYWLEIQTIENGAEVAASSNRVQAAQSTIPAPVVTPPAVHDSYNDSSTGGQASTADIAVIQSAKSQADLWLTTVIKTLAAHRDAPDPKIAALVNAFFKTKNQLGLDAILESYRGIQANLDSGITYEIDKTGKFWGRTGGYSTRASTLGENFFEATTILDEQAGTLIHEAAHRHVSPGLTGFRSKFEKYCYELYAHDDPANSPKAWNKLETSDLITTPDIYAAFAAAMNEGYYLGFWGCMPRPLRNTLKVGPP